MDQSNEMPANAIAHQAPQGQSEVRVIEDVIPVFDTGKFEHMMRIANLMADCTVLPVSLRAGQPRQALANCFMVVNQAVRWQMDPFALAQHAYVVDGRVGYEGKVIAAAINSDPRIHGRLVYSFDGAVGHPSRQVTVTGIFSDTGKSESISGTTQKWRTADDEGNFHEFWQGDCDQQLIYRGVREWARRHMPEKILGIYSADELDVMAGRGRSAPRMKDVTPKAARPPREVITPSTVKSLPPLVGDIPEPVVEPEPEEAAASPQAPARRRKPSRGKRKTSRRPGERAKLKQIAADLKKASSPAERQKVEDRYERDVEDMSEAGAGEALALLEGRA